VKFGFKRIRVG